MLEPLKRLLCKLLDVTEEEYDQFFEKFGWDADPAILYYSKHESSLDNISGLKRIMDKSNPYYKSKPNA